MFEWKTIPKEEMQLIDQIVKRFTKLSQEMNILPGRDTIEWIMDITAVHQEDCPLDLQKLLDAPDFDFIHDITGIYRHLNRDTGKLENHFLPRCALPVITNEEAV